MARSFHGPQPVERAGSRVRAYDELMGSVGPAAHYRAHRYPARTHLRPDICALYVDGRQYKVNDLSMNGLSFYVGKDQEFSVGQKVTLDISVGEQAAFDGGGEVSRVEPTGRGATVAVQLTSGFVDIPRLQAMQEESELQRELEHGTRDLLALVPPSYRRTCGDVVNLLRHHRSILDRYEVLMEPHRAVATDHLDQLVDRVLAHFRPEWEELRIRANELVAGVLDDPQARGATRRFTENVVTPEFMAAPNWRRCYEKPLGYPGDFQVMNYLYAGTREGDTAYARLMHQIGLEQPVAACVSPRMRMLREAIGAVVAASGEGEARVASIGCGPAREAEEYLALGVPPRRVTFTLVDQDPAALSYAYQQVFRQASRSNCRAFVDCYHISFVQMLRDRRSFDVLVDQDLIYSAGLFDYLEQAKARTLVATLFDRLRSGGTLLVGNMKAPTTGIWSIEFVLDWPLLYRTHDEMEDLVSLVRPAAASLQADPTGVTWMLSLRKP